MNFRVGDKILFVLKNKNQNLVASKTHGKLETIRERRIPGEILAVNDARAFCRLSGSIERHCNFSALEPYREDFEPIKTVKKELK